MEIEIRLGKISISGVAKLEELFGAGFKITRVYQDDKLFDGTISSTRIREKELFDATGASLQDFFSMIKEKNDSNREYVREIAHKSVEDLNLSVRSNNCMKNAGIKLIGELASSTEEDLLKIQNFARKSLNEVKDALADFGLTLGMKFENFPDPEIVQQMEK